MKKVLYTAVIFMVGAVGYCSLELLWRGYTHFSMGILGGICLCAMLQINRSFPHMPVRYRAFLCALFITLSEFIMGIIVNLVLHLSVWDYSKCFLNIYGQICPLYSAIWFLLSYAVLNADTAIRRHFSAKNA